MREILAMPADDNDAVHRADNITEAVQVIYDMAHSSMDWGSGFLDAEEMHAVIKFAILMGWKVPDLHSGPGYGPTVEVANTYPEHYEVSVRHSPYGDRLEIKTKDRV